jgi:PAS domain S-box-containing protein
MNKKIRILHLEDVPADAELIERELKKSSLDFEFMWVTNKQDFEKALKEFSPDVILSDHSIPSFGSIPALKMIRDKKMNIPFILITSTMSDEAAVDMMREGISDYLIKDRLHRLPNAIQNALEKFAVEMEKEKYHEEVVKNEKLFRALIENSADMKTLALPDGTLLYGSPSITKVLGFSPEEYLHTPAFELIHPDDIPGLMEQMMDIANIPGKSFYRQQRLKHKDGTWRWCEGTITNLLNEPGINALVSNFRDITNRKKTEDSILESEERYRNIVETAQEGIWTIDKNNRTNFVNKKVQEILEYSSEEMMGKLVFDFMDEEGKERAGKEIELQKKEPSKSREFKFLTKSGNFVWAQISTNPIFDGNGKYKGALAMLIDITERKIADETLRQVNFNLEQSEKKLKEAQAIANVGSWDLNFETGLGIWSDETCKIYGLPPNENVHSFNSWITFVHPEDLDHVNAEIKKSENSFGTFSIEHRIVLRDGTVKHLNSISKYELDVNGKPLGLVGISHDITERKKGKEKLEIANKELSTLFEAIDETFFSTDMVNYKLIQISSACEQVFGYPSKKFFEDPDLWKKVVHPDDQHLLDEEMIKLVKGETTRTENRIIRSDNEVRWVERKVIPTLNKEGKLIRVDGVVTDITDKKIAEQQLAKSEIQLRNFAKHTNQMLEDERSHIAREIHDELGQQLVGIKFGLSSFQKLHAEDVVLGKWLNGIKNEVDITINSMRKIATELRPGILDSLGLIPSIQWLVGEFEKRSGIKCVIDVSSRDQKFDKNISTCFFRICQEALTNISKHANATRVTVKITYKKNVLAIKITDDGKGISSEKLENPFSMGLLGMRERAIIVGGNLQIISKKKTGTTIQLSVKIK